MNNKSSRVKIKREIRHGFIQRDKAGVHLIEKNHSNLKFKEPIIINEESYSINSSSSDISSLPCIRSTTNSNTLISSLSLPLPLYYILSLPPSPSLPILFHLPFFLIRIFILLITISFFFSPEILYMCFSSLLSSNDITIHISTLSSFIPLSII